MDLEKFSNILGAETIKKIYDDSLSLPMQEIGKGLADFIKAARLFTAPIQLAASYQDRLVKFLSRIQEEVPPERQISAPASISGPILEKLRFLEEGNHLTELYLSLLQRAIDRERINEAHPAFSHIINQLSPDEAMILFYLKETELIIQNYDIDLLINGEGKKYLGPRKMTKDTIPKDKLVFIEHFMMYITHLESLNLVRWPILEELPIRNNFHVQTGLRYETQIILTEFGKLFVKACIPEKGLVSIVSPL